MLLGKPEMKAGSAFRYFDGALLDAVPDSGPFLMGAGNSDNPQHRVTVSDFWIYSTEVTNQMYDWCVSVGKCTPPDAGDNPSFSDAKSANHPVVGVSWQQASDYCGFAHGRLPTEAEWEKAASWDGANRLQLLFPWGNAAPQCDLLNFKYCVGRATSVVQYGQGRSYYGAYNMEGNVAEWVQDWYAAAYPLSAPEQDPAGPATGTARSIRGSAFDSDAIFASPAVRFSAPPTAHRRDLGFRCVVQDPSYYAPFCTVPASYGLSVSLTDNPGNPCPDPVIQHFEGCTLDQQPLDFVTVLVGGSTSVTVNGLQDCTPANNDVGVKHTCPVGVTVNVTATCGAAPAGAAACPPNYRADPNNPLQCTSPGAPGACPAGYQYDSSLQCCTTAANATAPAPLCSVGQHAVGGKCVSDVEGLAAPKSVSYVTSGVACVLTPSGFGAPTQIIPVPTNPPPTNPPPTNPPPTVAPPKPPHPPGHGGPPHQPGPPGGGKCKHNKHGCGGFGGFIQFFENLLSSL
jgi:hypothetical protein